MLNVHQLTVIFCQIDDFCNELDEYTAIPGEMGLFLVLINSLFGDFVFSGTKLLYFHAK